MPGNRIRRKHRVRTCPPHLLLCPSSAARVATYSLGFNPLADSSTNRLSASLPTPRPARALGPHPLAVAYRPGSSAATANWPAIIASSAALGPASTTTKGDLRMRQLRRRAAPHPPVSANSAPSVVSLAYRSSLYSAAGSADPPNSHSIIVCVMTPIAMKIVVTPNAIRNELNTRPAGGQRVHFAAAHRRSWWSARHVERVERREAMVDLERTRPSRFRASPQSPNRMIRNRQRQPIHSGSPPFTLPTRIPSLDANPVLHTNPNRSTQTPVPTRTRTIRHGAAHAVSGTPHKPRAQPLALVARYSAPSIPEGLLNWTERFFSAALRSYRAGSSVGRARTFNAAVAGSNPRPAHQITFFIFAFASARKPRTQSDARTMASPM